MSQYTKKEFSIIEDATAVASRYINTAHDLLICFMEKYFESAGDIEHLINELKYRPEIVESQVYAILHILSDGKQELDVFNAPGKLEFFFSEIEKKKEISKTMNE